MASPPLVTTALRIQSGPSHVDFPRLSRARHRQPSMMRPLSPDESVAARVLVIDDEPDLRELLAYNLTAAGFMVQVTESGAGGLAAVETFAPDVVVLDLMLPDIPGTDVCRRIRGGEARGLQPAVLMLTAKNDEIDRVVGFEIRADDYVVKPFSVRALVLRVGAIVRARRPSPASDPKSNLGCRYLVGPLELD